MIFLTVGTQLPFDRLVRAVDAWAGERRRKVFGQIAEPGPQGHVPRNFEWVPHLDPEDFRRRFEAADLIVAHAGMGSIIAALDAAKPILVFPRRAALGEQRNDHQLATARRVAHRPGVIACMEEAGLGPALDRLASLAPDETSQPLGGASSALIATLRAFVHGG